MHCGYYMLEYVEKWDGENVPQIQKEDIRKIKKVAPNKWLSAPFNQNKSGNGISTTTLCERWKPH